MEQILETVVHLCAMLMEIFGVSVLVVPERTAEACLRAYRNGNFYGAAHGLGELRFTSIVFDGKRLCATTDKPAKFEVITARGVRKTSEGMSVEWVCPDDDRDRKGDGHYNESGNHHESDDHHNKSGHHNGKARAENV
jgi:hypothetical protein